MQRDGHGHRPAPPQEANDLVVTSVITAGWATALVVTLILLAAGVLPAGQRWWVWTCATGVAMGVFGLWYVPVLQRNRARAAARHAGEAAGDAAGPAGRASAAGRAGAEDQASGPASGYTSRDNGSKTVSSTETPGSSTRS
jgi:Protein of unknown function (DUF2530)